jgi:hypothetical protein
VLVAGAVLAPVGLVLSIILFGGGSQAAADVCSPTGSSVSVDASQLPKVAVAGYEGEQLKNAALIINAGKALGLSARGQTIGVMTAMGESGLRVLDHGDGPGPDSRGLFQQRDNGAWGTYQDRMNPTASASNFFKALQKINGWEQLEPTTAAHRVQRNADPFHYRPYWAAAVEVVAALGDVKITDAGGESSCGIPGQSGKTMTCRGARPRSTSHPRWACSTANASTSPSGESTSNWAAPPPPTRSSTALSGPTAPCSAPP